jgi:hypothetical protein
MDRAADISATREWAAYVRAGDCFAEAQQHVDSFGPILHLDDPERRSSQSTHERARYRAALDALRCAQRDFDLARGAVDDLIARAQRSA